MGDNVFKQDFGGLGGFLGGLAQRGASPELGMIENEQYTDRIISAIEDGFLTRNDPSQAAKKNISAEAYRNITQRSDEIRSSEMSDEDKRAALSELLTGEGIPHDPSSLDVFSPSDAYGLLSKRVNIIDGTSSSASSGSPVGGGSTSSSDSTEIEDLSAADPDLIGDVDQTVEDLRSDATTYEVGDVITDGRILGDYPYVYDKEANVFHYVPFDEAGNRTYTGETLDASSVAGFDPDAADTGASRSIIFDPETQQPSIEQIGQEEETRTEDSEQDSSTINIDVVAEGLLDILNRLPNYGPFQTTSNNANENVQDTVDQGTGNQGTGDNGLGDGGLGDGGLGDGGLGDGGDGGDGDGGDGEIDVNVIPIPNLGGGTAIDEGIRNTGTGIPDGGGGALLKMFDVIQDTPVTRSILFEPKFRELDNVQLGMFEQFLRAAGGNQ